MALRGTQCNDTRLWYLSTHSSLLWFDSLLLLHAKEVHNSYWQFANHWDASSALSPSRTPSPCGPPSPRSPVGLWLLRQGSPEAQVGPLGPLEEQRDVDLILANRYGPVSQQFVQTVETHIF